MKYLVLTAALLSGVLLTLPCFAAGDPRVLVFEQKIDANQSADNTVKRLDRCEVDIAIDYWQSNDKVKIQAYIDTPDCEAAYGDYTISVKTKNEADEYHTNKYPEVWSRTNAEPLEMKHSYSMNGDTDLVKVQTKLSLGNSCRCGVRPVTDSEKR